MKIITKSKLPRWLIFILPFGEEEDVLMATIIPFMLLLVFGICTFIYEFYKPSDILNFWVSLFFLSLFIISVWWLSLQVDILNTLRRRLKYHYQIVKDEEEKVKTKKRLSDLCIKV